MQLGQSEEASHPEDWIPSTLLLCCLVLPNNHHHRLLPQHHHHHDHPGYHHNCHHGFEVDCPPEFFPCHKLHFYFCNHPGCRHYLCSHHHPCFHCYLHLYFLQLQDPYLHPDLHFSPVCPQLHPFFHFLHRSS